MEEILQTRKDYKLAFNGKGNDFFGIIIVNWLLTIITLGIYYPWAKARKLQFLYSQTSLNGDPFTFHGTGKELFKGLLKAILFFTILGCFNLVFFYFKMPFLGTLITYIGIFAILPLALHGAYRYRMSRTSWRGIRFGYQGNRKEFTLQFFKWSLLTLVTFGIYSSWMNINVRKYMTGNIRFGDAEFDYEGDGADYFIMNLKGYLLTLFTFGIYFAWWKKELFEYYINNLSLRKEDKEVVLTSTVTGGGYLKLGITNFFIVVFTLGLGYSWAVTRTLQYVFSHIEVNGYLDLDNLNQKQENYKDASGEDLSDFLDVDFVM